MKSVIRILVTFVLLFVLSLGGLSAQTVNPNGSLSYSYPIQLPPGTGGMVPKLSINYNSGGRNGFLGMGFSLGGLSAITRDGSYDINFDDTTDHFSYNGQRLIPGSDGYYHTEKESFIRIKFENPNASDSHWLVTMKNGTRLFFGNTADSHVDAVGKSGKALVWCR